MTTIEKKPVAKKTTTTKATTKKTEPNKTEKATTKKAKEPEVKPVESEIKVITVDNCFISNFLNNVYSDSALYMNYRSTPSYIDGLKNSGRKCIYTVKKKNLKSEVKVCNFAGSVTDESNYLHGPASMEGTIVTLSKEYCGSNNLPFLKGVGAFGTRFSPQAAATRYIFIKQTDYMNELIKKEDDINLVSQEFEGDEIEPMFYVPTIPMLLVNGAVGIGVGFTSKILNRPLENVITMVENKLNKKPVADKLFTPGWKGFNGKVEQVDSCKWKISGNAEIEGNKVKITELPISWNLQDYLQYLKSLRDKPSDEKKAKKWVKKIEKYNDFSEDDIFSFEIKLTPDEAKKSKDEILDDLGLVEVISENLICIDENNAIREFTSVQDVFDSFYKVKIKYLKKRIISECNRLEEELAYYDELYRFIMEVIKGTINIKLKKAEVEAEMKKKKYVNIDKLISIPLYSITKDKAEEAKKRVDDKKAELELIKKETPENLWKKDIDDLKKVLKKEGKI